MTESDLVLELGEGFADDEVEVLVDGELVWQRRGVTTNYSVGIADVVRLSPPAAGSRLEVRTRRLSGSASLSPARGGDDVRLRAAIDSSGAGLTLGPAPDEPIF